LEDGERALEHLAGWALCGWPLMPLERAREKGMFLPTDALDNYLEGRQASPIGIRPQPLLKRTGGWSFSHGRHE
jgi:hypothetical protein